MLCVLETAPFPCGSVGVCVLPLAVRILRSGHRDQATPECATVTWLRAVPRSLHGSCLKLAMRTLHIVPRGSHLTIFPIKSQELLSPPSAHSLQTFPLQSQDLSKVGCHRQDVGCSGSLGTISEPQLSPQGLFWLHLSASSLRRTNSCQP